MKKFFQDESAAEVTELGIVLALIVAISILIISAIGVKVQAAFNSVNTALP